MARNDAWDDTFMELMLDDVKESIEDAIKSRRKVFEHRITMSSLRGEVITIDIRKERR
ncbi:MAG: hypothetical protein IT306_14670 [Chloroflexi bacterium]|nr:hypothetical protein [Chloroflexota bacterium]